MELVKIKDGIFYIKDTTNLPLIEAGSSFLLFDSPIDKDKGKKVIKIIKEKGLNVNTLIFSHHHADHVGGGKFLKDFLNLKTYSSTEEKIFIENTILEPIYLSIGGKPSKEFLNKWVYAESTIVDDNVKNLNLNILDLSGHSIGMIGIIIDEVLFPSDTFFSPQILEKYEIPYFYSYSNFIKRLEEIKNIDFEYVLPSHGELYNRDEGIKVIEENTKKLIEIKEKILEIIKEEKTIEEILDKLNLKVESYIVSILIKSSIFNLLNESIDLGEVELIIKKGVVFYKKI